MTEYDKLRNALDEVYYGKAYNSTEDRVDILREVLAKIVDWMEEKDKS